jgi:hypothetical protein
MATGGEGSHRAKYNGCDVAIVERVDAFTGGVGCYLVELPDGERMGAYGDEIILVPEPRPGGAYPCPDCGAEDWRVTYQVYQSQDAAVSVGEDGRPVVGEYRGNTCVDYDGGRDVEMSCQECGTLVPLDVQG